MSHISTVGPALKDLNALKSAVRELGAQWLEGVKTYKSYQSGLTSEHVINLPGCAYQIGVTKSKDGTYALNWDTYGEGQKLLKHFGEGCKKLAASYSVHKTMNWWRAKGLTVQRVPLGNGRTAVDITGYGL